MNTTSLLIAILLLGAGFFYYWRIAQKVPRDLSFSGFFLGGGHIGPQATHETNWGLSLAFANAFWYFTYLTYHYGLQAVLWNLPWVLSVALFGFKVGVYLRASKHGTVHSFLGHAFSPSVRIVAAVATTIGYFLNCGFEVYYSSHLIMASIGSPSVELSAALVLALFCGLYTMTGGYRANLVTDVPQNKLAAISIALLVILVSINLFQNPSPANALYEAFVGVEIPTFDFVAGIFVFAFFFNFVDMANWQSAAANAKDSDEMPASMLSELQWSYYRSAIKQMVAPALLAGLLGMCLRMHTNELNDEQLYGAALKLGLDSLPTILSGILLGVILLGFLSATLSSADNYLLACAQTMVNDIFYFKRYTAIRNISDASARLVEEERFVRSLRRRLPALSMLMVALFAVLFSLMGANVFGLQFVMYGSAITLFPCLFFALRAMMRDPSGYRSRTSRLSAHAFWSIVVGITTMAVTFFCAERIVSEPAFADMLAALRLTPRASLIQNSAPLIAIGTATLVFVARKWKMRLA